MSALRTTLILAALTLSSPAPAAVAVTLGDALLSRPLLSEDDRAAAAATQDYFDADALLTLGAMALAGGALAAASRRPQAVAAKPADGGSPGACSPVTRRKRYLPQCGNPMARPTFQCQTTRRRAKDTVKDENSR